MLASVPPTKAGFCLTDRSDPKYQYIRSLRHRYGVFLHSASVCLRQQGEENTVDAVHMLVCKILLTFGFKKATNRLVYLQIRSFRVYLLEYGDSRDRYDLDSYDRCLSLQSLSAFMLTKNNLPMRRTSPVNMRGRKYGRVLCMYVEQGVLST